MSARSRAHPWFRTTEDYARRCAEWAASQPRNSMIILGPPLVQPMQWRFIDLPPSVEHAERE